MQCNHRAPYGTHKRCIDELKVVIDSHEPIDSFAGRLEPPQALQVLRLLQEAPTNVLKHALASEIRIHANKMIRKYVAAVAVSVAGNGVGFDTATIQAGRGLKNMREQAEKLGGAAHGVRRGGGGSDRVDPAVRSSPSE